MLDSIKHFFIATWLRFRVSRIHVSQDAKCPACGNHQGLIKWSSKDKLLIHTCLICRATWGEEPVVEVSAWLK